MINQQWSVGTYGLHPDIVGRPGEQLAIHIRSRFGLLNPQQWRWLDTSSRHLGLGPLASRQSLV